MSAPATTPVTAPFTARHRLRFAHCDPAGIAYYPRLFELADAVIEDWTEAVLGLSRRTLHIDMLQGLPTVALQTRFARVSRLGDWLDMALTVDRLGTSSIDFTLSAHGDGEERFTVTYTQVLVDLREMRRIPWPAAWRTKIEETMA